MEREHKDCSFKESDLTVSNEEPNIILIPVLYYASTAKWFGKVLLEARLIRGYHRNLVR